MFLIGLTGGISTGKSLVSSFFKDSDVPVIDADLIARQIVEPGKPAYLKVVKAFGTEILNEDGEINRAKLGSIIFSSSEKRRVLNSITHPYIYGEMRKRVIKLFWKGEQFVAMDLPLLYETRSVISYLFKIIVVSCDEDTQIKRLISRNNYSLPEAKSRIEAQMPLETKTSIADFVIENSGSIADTRKQFEDILKVLRSSKRHIRNRNLIYGILIGVLLLFIGVIYLIMTVFFLKIE